ncbi:hypothetical protein Taro_018329, partial [Colocasia esculenta]|nr:hypothetical protein [Colocasia esculenta]
AGKSTGGTRSTGHENQKTRRSPPSTCCSELNGKNTPETKRVVAEAVAVYKVNVAAEQYPNPVPPSSSPFLEYRVAEGKKTSGTFAKPSTERFTEKLRRPHPEKAAGRSRTGTSKRLTGQSKIQLPSPKPEPWPSPPPRRPPVRPPAVRPLEE